MVAACEKRLFRFFLSKIEIKKEFFHWYSTLDLYSPKAHSQSMAHLGLEREASSYKANREPYFDRSN